MDRWVPELFLISLLAAFCGGLAWIHDHELFCRRLCRGCGGCSFPGTPALTRSPRKIGAKEDGDDHDENSLHA
jgi:MinD superfamily P-loop ATPase